MRSAAVITALFALATNVAAQEHPLLNGNVDKERSGSLARAAEASAQEQTLLKGEKTGAFGGPVVKFTRIHGRTAVMVGGRGGWIIGRSLVLGGGGYGVATEVDAPEGALQGEGPLDIKFGYGGFDVEYLLQPDSLWHLSVGTLVGGGDNHFVRDVGPLGKSTQTTGESDAVWVVEPGVNAELNVTPWFRVAGGVSYRFVGAVDQVVLKKRDFNGPAATLTLRFGTF
jgi:hypothetical protein